MNFRTICIVSAVLVVVSFFLTCGGSTASHIRILSEHFHWQIVINIAVPLFTSLLTDVALVVFFLAFIKRLRTPDAETPSAFIIAGCMLILAAVVNGGFGVMVAVGTYEHLPRMQFLLIAGLQILHFFAVLSLGVFILTRAVSKSLATLAVAAQLGLFAGSIAFYVQSLPNFPKENLLMLLGTILSSSGFIVWMVAILLFMFAFLRIPSHSHTDSGDITEAVPA